eukprot:351937-Chlamydomonas_euryale.AAC.7
MSARRRRWLHAAAGRPAPEEAARLAAKALGVGGDRLHARRRAGREVAADDGRVRLKRAVLRAAGNREAAHGAARAVRRRDVALLQYVLPGVGGAVVCGKARCETGRGRGERRWAGMGIRQAARQSTTTFAAGEGKEYGHAGRFGARDGDGEVSAHGTRGREVWTGEGRGSAGGVGQGRTVHSGEHEARVSLLACSGARTELCAKMAAPFAQSADGAAVFALMTQLFVHSSDGAAVCSGGAAVGAQRTCRWRQPCGGREHGCSKAC